MQQQIHTYRLRKLKSTVASVAFGVFLMSNLAYAAPTGGVINAGSGSIAQNGLTTTITQNSDLIDINWDTFNVGSLETVHFDQVHNQAIAINRIQDVNPSVINGTLLANGRVFLINKAGLTFGSSAQVNVGALVATTSDIINQNGFDFDFAGGNNSARVINQGDIHIAEGGFAVLSAPKIENTGSITAKGGTIALASATEFTLNTLSQNISFTANTATAGAIGADVAGSLSAQGGDVIIQARQAVDLAATMINLDGEIDVSAATSGGAVGDVDVFSDGHLDAKENLFVKANALDTGAGGDVLLIADKVAVYRNGAQTQAKGGDISGNGGFIEFSGYDRLHVLGAGFNTTGADGNGTVLFDPQDIIVQTGGGGSYADVDLFSDNSGVDITIDPATLDAVAGDVVLEATRDLLINDSITLTTAGASFTGRANNNITMAVGTSISTNNGDITLAADYDFSGAGGPAADGVGGLTVRDLDAGTANISLNLTAGTLDVFGDVVTTVGDIDFRSIGGMVRVNAGYRVDSGTGDLTIDNRPVSLDLSEHDLNDRILVQSGGRLYGDNIILRSRRIGTSTTALNNAPITALTSVTLEGVGEGDVLTDAPLITFDNNQTYSGSNEGLKWYGANPSRTVTFRTLSGAHFIERLDMRGDLIYQGTMHAELGFGGSSARIFTTGNFIMDTNSYLSRGTDNAYLYITADSDGDGVGNIIMNSGSYIRYTNLFMHGADDTQLGELREGQVGNSDVTFTFTNPGGLVSDNNGAAVNLNNVSAIVQSTLSTNGGDLGTSTDAIEATGNIGLVLGDSNVANAHDVFLSSDGDIAVDNTYDGASSSINLASGGDLSFTSAMNKSGVDINLASSSGSINLADATSTTGGNIIIRAADDITVGGDLTTTGGYIDIAADYDFSGAGGAAPDGVGDVSLASGVAVATNGGDFTLTSTGGNVHFGTSVNVNTSGGDISVTKTSGQIWIDYNAVLNAGTGDVTLNVTPLSGDYSTLNLFNDEIFNNGSVLGENLDLRARRLRDANTGYTVGYTGNNSIYMLGDTYGQRKQYMDGLRIYALNIHTPTLTYDNAHSLNAFLNVRNNQSFTLNTTSNTDGFGYIQSAGDLTFNGQFSGTSTQGAFYVRDNIYFGANSYIETTSGSLSLYDFSADTNNDGVGNIIMDPTSYLNLTRNHLVYFKFADEFRVSSVAAQNQIYLNSKNNNASVIDNNGAAVNFSSARVSLNKASGTSAHSINFGSESDKIETNIERLLLSQATPHIYMDEVDDLIITKQIPTDYTELGSLDLTIAGTVFSRDNSANTIALESTAGDIRIEKTAGDFVVPEIITDSGDITLISANNLDVTTMPITTSGNITLVGNDIINFNDVITTTADVSLTSGTLTFGGSAGIHADKISLNVPNLVDVQNVIATSTDADAVTLQNLASFTDINNGNAQITASAGGVLLQNATATVNMHVDSASATFDNIQGDLNFVNDQLFSIGSSTVNGHVNITMGDGTPLESDAPELELIKDNLVVADGFDTLVNGEDPFFVPVSDTTIVDDVINQTPDRLNDGSKGKPIVTGPTTAPNTEVSGQPQTEPEGTTVVDLGGFELEIEVSETPTSTEIADDTVTENTDANKLAKQEDEEVLVAEEGQSVEGSESTVALEVDDTFKKLLLGLVPDRALNLKNLKAYLEGSITARVFK